jgi:YfiR/HmsC-like
MAQTVDINKSALFVFNFTKYIDWPDDGFQEFTIGIFGNAAALDVFQKQAIIKKFGQLSIKTKLCAKPSDTRDCQLVYITKPYMLKSKSIISFIGDKPILIVTEGEGQTKISNAHISIYQQNDKSGKTSFEISKKNIENSNLKVSSQLLNIGR